MNKLKKGDSVIVIAGKDKGKEGAIVQVLPGKNKLIVEKINIIKKHVKATPDADGGIIEKEAAIHASNVKLIAPGSKKATRIGFKVVKGKKSRVAKVTGDSLK
jgi:large subunit ribosomal protein L24